MSDMSDNKETPAMSCEVAREPVKRTDQSKEGLIELERQYKDAAKFLDEATDAVKESWVRWLEESRKYLGETRTLRFAIEKEVRDGKAVPMALSRKSSLPKSVGRRGRQCSMLTMRLIRYEGDARQTDALPP